MLNLNVVDFNYQVFNDAGGLQQLQSGAVDADADTVEEFVTPKEMFVFAENILGQSCEFAFPIAIIFAVWE